ncbi:von Willebrand factor [Macleaya cordata]|uniref:von Willebrand factor n=1 Tax=Macleaya cordata TaxID=56857 RepID=A0A200QD66_MACCD|nr:von Willebrand factor [Macleaya cordata]
MAEEFVKSVEDGLKLSKRIYFGKDRSVLPPKPVAMEKSSNSHLPTAPMVYAVISDPSIVDNPDIPSYQPHVHGRCDPPALIPLQMNGIEIEADCYLDTAFITINGSWRVHCVMGSRSCDCRLAIPMGEQGSILGVEVDVNRRSYCSQLTSVEESTDMAKVAKAEDGGFLKPQIFILTIPQVDGGSNLSVKVRWSQKLVFDAGQFSVNIPFSFPEYVTPAGKKISKREKIQLNVNPGIGTEVLCKTSSHPLKEIRRQAGKLGFLYEADVITWSSTEFNFSYAVSSNDISSGLLLQSPSINDLDQREMFCFYLNPGNYQTRKVFRRKVVFVIDTSESMKGKPLENVKNALSTALSKLNPEDSFSVIAFNGETYLFSSSLVPATEETVENAIQWISINFVAGGGTNILQPLNQAIEMLSNTRDSIPLIFLITDGAVEDERHICDVMKTHMTNGGSMSPRISTFGIGTYCNHYFLQMLALIGRGYYNAAYDVDSVDVQMQKFFTTASSIILANITIDSFEHLDALEIYPSQVPDLLSGSPLIVSGRYEGKFPDFLKARGVLADLSNFEVDLKVQKAKDIPLDRVFAKKHIDVLTAQAWFTQTKQLEEKVAAKVSILTGVPSEYTRMVVLQTDGGTQTSNPIGLPEVNKMDLQKMVDSKGRKIMLLQSLGIGFGNLMATAENIPPGFGEPQLPEPVADAFVKAASNCCSRLSYCCCCNCCIQCCSKVNDQCAIVLIQLCTALSCLGCLCCCSDD